MSEYKEIIQEFFNEYQGNQYRHELRKGTREDYVVALVIDTVTGNVMMKEVSTRVWIDSQTTEKALLSVERRQPTPEDCTRQHKQDYH